MGQKKHKYPVQLSQSERSELNRRTMQGRIQVRELKRAQLLLLADENQSGGGQTDKAIAARIGVSMPTVERTRRRYVESGLEAALKEAPRSGRPARISGEVRAQITALPARRRPLVMAAGVCACWPTRRSNWPSSSRFRMRPWGRC